MPILKEGVSSLKNTGIACMLALLPSLLIGTGLLLNYIFQGKQFVLILCLLGFIIGWGWGYAYLGHTLRAVAAFFSGYVVSFSVFMVMLQGIGVTDGPYEAKRYDDFAEVFFMVVLVVVIAVGIGLTIDAARLTRQHNRMIPKKSRSEKTWKPTVAGILCIISTVLIYINAFWVSSSIDGNPLAPLSVLTWFTPLFAIFSVIIATLILLSGVLAVKRKRWGLALIGSIIMCAYVVHYFVKTSFSLYDLPIFWGWLGIPSFILISFSRNEFKRQCEQKVLEQRKDLGQQKELNVKQVLGGMLVLFGCILIPIGLVWFGLGTFGTGEVYLGIIFFIGAMLVFGISLYIKRKLGIKMPSLIWWQ